MSTFHAVTWIDHSEAHVLMFDREHVEAQRVKSRSHHKHQGKGADNAAFFADVAAALKGAHEVLLCGPGLARTQFREWANTHHAPIAANIVESIPADHPSDAQLAAMARQYFKKFDMMAGDPTTL